MADDAIKDYNREVYYGAETAWSSVADFFIDPGEKTQSRKGTHFDQGNPGQCFVGRAGPDGVDPTQGFVTPVEVGINQNVGHFAFFAYDGENWVRIAQMHCRYQGNGTGDIYLAPGGVERLGIRQDGYLDITNLLDDSGGVRVIANGRKGHIPITWED